LKAKPIILLAVILLTTSIFTIYKKSDTIFSSSNHTWKVTTTYETTFSKNVGGFLNKDYGITVGNSGEIHYTKDGSKTWEDSKNYSPCLFGLSIVNSKVAYACGNASYVVKITDGGESWNKVSNFGHLEPNHARYMSFVNENIGWIATQKEYDYSGLKFMLGSTLDGGKTWLNVELPEEIEEIVAIYLTTAENGFILDSKSNLYITKDSGKSFSKQAISLPDTHFKSAEVPQVALHFSDDNNGLIVYEGNNLRIAAARTCDGGKTWVNEPFPDLYYGGLYLSQDGKLLSLTRYGEPIKILEYK
jgi:photosystem II stability/assembly factor-like uncharacterized protein